jgi:hypothetical protein
MGVADYIEKRFLGKELCISVNNGETETVAYDCISSMNREYLQGLVIEAEDDVIMLEIANWGAMYINVWDISFFWEPSRNLHAAFHASLTEKLGRTPR